MSTLLAIAIFALVPAYVARKKGRSFLGYYFLSFITSPIISLIIVLVLKSKLPSDNADGIIDVEAREVTPEEMYTTEPGTAENSAFESAAEEADPYIATPTAAPSGVIHCTHCGAEILAGSTHCSYCDSRVE